METTDVVQSPETGMVLATEALTRRFGELTAVDRMTISVHAGEVFGMLGPNGAGKTTAIKMLTTLLPPTAGRACIAGFDVVHDSARVRRVIGYVPQLLSADGALTGYENLAVFARLYDIPRAERSSRIRDALSFMDLETRVGPAGPHLLGRHDPAARDRPEHAAPAAGAVPGRADRRP